MDDIDQTTHRKSGAEFYAKYRASDIFKPVPDQKSRKIEVKKSNFKPKFKDISARERYLCQLTMYSKMKDKIPDASKVVYVDNIATLPTERGEKIIYDGKAKTRPKTSHSNSSRVYGQ